MNPAKTLSFADFFACDKVVAWTSDRSMDFTLDESTSGLQAAQKEYCSKRSGFRIWDVAWAKQVHGAEILVVDKDFVYDGPLQSADALITDQMNVPIAVRTADCLPIFIFDPTRWVIAIVHAGWRGTHQEIAMRILHTMRKNFGTWFSDLKIVFGPAIGPCCYKVEEEFYKYFPHEVVAKEQDLYLNLAQVNRRQLTALGVMPSNIFDCGVCTSCDQNFFSFRREGSKAGRMISMMLLKGE